jgi:putative transposase
MAARARKTAPYRRIPSYYDFATHRPELRSLIRRMATENPLWSEERIANELLVKLGIRVSPRTAGKYVPKRPPGQPRGDQRWSTFLKNHAKAILACDFFIAGTLRTERAII